MYKTKFLAATAMAALFAIPASAQVASSFDNLVDEVLAETNASFFSGAINTADINASINIAAGVGAVAGTAAGSFSVLDGAFATSSGATGEGAADTVAGNLTSITGAFETSTNEITQNFGEISTVAAGAISDSTMELNQTGALATAAVNSSASSTSFQANASDLTGESFGVVQTALNTADINGSITMSAANANIIADSVGTVAAGAINTGSITATFVGGSESAAEIGTP